MFGDQPLSKIYPQKWGQLALLLGLCIVLFFVNLGQWDLWNSDELRYAQASREMVDRGDWILMHSNGRVYPDKPPMFFWFVALSSYVWGGFNSFSARFPSAFFGTLTVLLTFFLGRKLFCSRTGFLSGLVLATNTEFVYLTTRGNIDATFTFFTTASLFCLVYWYGGRQEKEKSTLDRLSIYGFYVAMALATLTKGLLGFVLPLMVALGYLLIRKDWQGMRGMKLLPGIPILLAIVLAWYLPAVSKGGPGYLNETLFRHTIDRYTEGWSHARPMYYYLFRFPGNFLPWIFFLPAGMIYAYMRGKIEKKGKSLFLLLWFVLIFVFFSLSKGKRELYLLPLYPAASLMVGKVWVDFISGSTDPLRQEWISLALCALMGFVLIAGLVIPPALYLTFPSYLLHGLPMSLLLVAGSVAMYFLYRSKHHGTIFFLTVVIVVAGFFYTLRTVFPLVNPFKSGRFISREVTLRIKPGEHLALYGHHRTEPYNFYTGIVPIIVIEGKQNLPRFLQSPVRVFCLLGVKDFNALMKEEGRPEVELIAQRPVGDDLMVLISNRQEPSQ